MTYLRDALQAGLASLQVVRRHGRADGGRDKVHRDRLQRVVERQSVAETADLIHSVSDLYSS